MHAWHRVAGAAWGLPAEPQQLSDSTQAPMRRFAARLVRSGAKPKPVLLNKSAQKATSCHQMVLYGM
jgi:hypothetical protein